MPIRGKTKTDFSECPAIDADGVTDQFSNKEMLLLRLCCVTFINDLPTWGIY